MTGPMKIGLLSLLMVSIVTGTAYATRPVPQDEPQAVIQNETATALPGDVQGLARALAAGAPFKAKILIVDGTAGEDRTDYLDRVAAAWGQPAGDTLLLVLFRENNWDIRFYMGAVFHRHQVTVGEMVRMVREVYLPKARVGDPAGGLADTLSAVTRRLGGGPGGRVLLTAPNSSYPKCPDVADLVPTDQTDQPQLLALVPKMVAELYTTPGYEEYTNVAPALAAQAGLHGAMVKTWCGATVAESTWVVKLTFPKNAPSTSMSAGQFMVSKTRQGWQVWFRYH